MKKILFRVFVGMQILLLLVLLCTRFIPFLNPKEYSIMGVLGLFTPLLAVLNIVFILYWLLSRKYLLCILAFLGFVVSWNVLSVCFAFNILERNEFVSDQENFTVMSYNVRLLDLYDWTGKQDTRKKMLQLIKKENPDVLCLQEFYSKGNSGLDNIRIIKELVGYPYHAECNIKRHKNRKWGSVVFSKYPIENSESVLINEENKNLIQDCYININEKKVRVFNVHLHSNKLSGKDINWKDVQEEKQLVKKAEKAIAQSKSIFEKLTKAYVQRGEEVNLSTFLIEEDNQTPTIICGDLNDLPSSYSYFNIRSDFKDAFLEKGIGVGATYNGRISFLRIDYIFHQEALRLNGFKKINAPYSDHYPLFASFNFTR